MFIASLLLLLNLKMGKFKEIRNTIGGDEILTRRRLTEDSAGFVLGRLTEEGSGGARLSESASDVSGVGSEHGSLTGYLAIR